MAQEDQAKPLPPLPKFDGPVYMRDGSREYIHSAYQYATTSYPKGWMEPAAVVYVANESDIFKAIDYAHKADIAVSVRSGGHQYAGASSSAGRNIQLDVSGFRYDPESMGLPKDTTYPFFYCNLRKTDKGRPLVDVGCAVGLTQMAKKFNEFGVFSPYGECGGVHFGGHCQTGGVCAISATFGLLCDHIQQIIIVTADGDPKTGSVARKRVINRNTKDKEEADIFFSTIGGSPGNFGVILGATVAPYWDTDFPNARISLQFYPYSKDTWERFMTYTCSACDKGGFPSAFSLSVGMAPTTFMPFGESKLDAEMQNEDPDIFFGPLPGDSGAPTFTQEQRDDATNLWLRPVPMILINAMWCDRENPHRRYEDAPEAQEFFRALRNVSQVGKIEQWVIDKMIPPVYAGITEKVYTPVSEYMSKMALPIIREWLLPGTNLFFVTDSTTQVQDGFPHYNAETIDKIEGFNPVAAMSTLKAAQQFVTGGHYWRNPPDDKTSVSFRKNLNMCGTFSTFYAPSERGAENARNWINEVRARCIGPDGLVAKKDMRLVWSPLGAANMDKQWMYHFDSREKYERILNTKRRVDPHDIFTPNGFCIGANTSAKLWRNLPQNVRAMWELDGPDVKEQPAEANSAKRARASASPAKRDSPARARSRK